MMSPRCDKYVVEMIIERINGMSENLKKLVPCRAVEAHHHYKSSVSELTKSQFPAEVCRYSMQLQTAVCGKEIYIRQIKIVTLYLIVPNMVRL